jgi:hypothetical protein
MPYDFTEFEDKAYRLGLVNIWAYHCNRCNYVWLPRNFDYARSKWQIKDLPGWNDFGQDLIAAEPPKSCARCKSKYWRDGFMRRVSKSARVDGESKFIEEPTSWARMRTLIAKEQYLEAAHLRPELKALLLKSKVLRKVKINGKKHITDGAQYLTEPEPKPEKENKK